MKILILEDDPILSELIREYLSGMADDIHVVKSWKEAEPYIKDAHIFWVDLVLPPHDDADTSLIRIRDVRRRHANTVILIVSGALDHDIEKRAIEAGADVFCAKSSIARKQVVAMIMLACTAACRNGRNADMLLERAQRFIKNEIAGIEPKQASL